MLSAKSKSRPNLSQLLHMTQGLGVRPRAVLVDKVVDDLPELGLQVERIEGDAEPVGDTSRVFGVGRAAATLFVPGTLVNDWQYRGPRVDGAGLSRFLAMPHEHAGDIVARFEQQVRSRAAIDSARHRQHDPRHIRPLPMPSVPRRV